MPQVAFQQQDGSEVVKRFCQRCGRFHTLAAFNGARKSCMAKLDEHNRRRRRGASPTKERAAPPTKRQAALQAAQQTTAVPEPAPVEPQQHLLPLPLPLPPAPTTARGRAQSLHASPLSPAFAASAPLGQLPSHYMSVLDNAVSVLDNAIAALAAQLAAQQHAQLTAASLVAQLAQQQLLLPQPFQASSFAAWRGVSNTTEAATPKTRSATSRRVARQ
jgi:hypothetical protein